MKPITLAVLAAAALASAACGTKGTPAKPGDGSAPLHAKKVQLSWGISQRANDADVFLQTTDETGAQVSHSLGTFPGQCAVIMPNPDMNAMTGVACVAGAAGVQLHALAQDGQVVVLRMRTAQGEKPDPMAREEALRFAVAPGSAIEARP